MSTGHILVIAPNADFRLSLAFALETEGYVVTARDSLPARPAGNGYDAVVLDHKATTGPRDAVTGFCRDSGRVVLLAGRPQPWLQEQVFRTVPTPLMGGALSEAVADAVQAGPTTPHH